MNEKNEIDLSEFENKDELIGDPLDLMTKAIKVHSKNIDLNEDATLSNLDSQLSKFARYVMEQVAIVGILNTFFRTDAIIIKRSNKLEKWGEEIRYINPEKKHFNHSKQILMNKVHSVLLLSRSVKGRPLKAFLTYGKPNEETKDKEKAGLISRILGKEDKPEEDQYG